MLYDEETEVFTCQVCGAEGIVSWPYVHCWRCGNREDRPDLGLDKNAQPVQTQGAVYGGATPDGDTTSYVPGTQAGGEPFTAGQTPGPGPDAFPPGPPPAS